MPAAEDESYVIVRLESETDNSDNRKFVTNVVVVTDIVTAFQNSVNPDIADDIEQEIKTAVKPLVGSTFDNTVDLQFVSMRAESSTYLNEDDGTKKYYRKNTRWACRVVQLTT